MTTRREFLTWTAASGVGLAVGGRLLSGQARAASAVRAARAAPTAAPALTPYLDPMPTLVDNLIDARGGGTVDLSTSLITRKLHSQLNPTTLFGYLWAKGPTAGKLDASYLGPVILAQNGQPVTVNYTNGLAADAYLSVFKGGSSYTQFNANGTRILTHLHGAIDSGVSDGNPFETPGAYGPGGMQTAMYPNAQPATLSWYHDHLLGDTRMNVVGGLAGGYLLRDDFDSGSNPLLPNNKPNGNLYELPMVVQDRQFNTDGSLLYPTAPASTNGPWIGEYFGDVMMVNGMIWPKLAVEPAVYRFRVLNGCNARILNLRIARSNDQTVPTYIIGTEGGLLPLNPTATNSLVMAPAERFDVICDFRGLGGQTLLMKNTNLPNGMVSSPAPTLATVMQINVAKTASAGAPMTIPPAGSLKDPLVLAPVKELTDLGAPLLSGGTVKGRMITLNEFAAGTSNWQLNLNGYPYGATTGRDHPPGVDRDADVEQLRRLVLRELHAGHAPDAHPPVLVQSDGPLQLRHQGLRRAIQRKGRSARRSAEGRSTAGRLHADSVPEVETDRSVTGRDRTQGDGEGEPGAGHGRARQVHSAARAWLHDAKVRAPLPHRRTRRQRHDGTRDRTAPVYLSRDLRQRDPGR